MPCPDGCLTLSDDVDVDVEEMDVSFACSYFWMPRRAILTPFVNHRLILRRLSSNSSSIKNDMSNNMAVKSIPLDERTDPIWTNAM
jgi:hypothetical protein